MMQKLIILKDLINLQQLLYSLIDTSMGTVSLSNKEQTFCPLSHLI